MIETDKTVVMTYTSNVHGCAITRAGKKFRRPRPMAPHPEEEIAHLAHTILGDPERNIERFKEFFQFGVSADPEQANQTTDLKLRSLALLSATAVLIDIFPSMIAVDDGQEEDANNHQKSSKDQHARLKRSQIVVTMFDQLLNKMAKIKLVRGVCAILNSSLCSKQCLDLKRAQQLVTTAVSLSVNSTEAIAALRERIRADLSNNVDNLDVVKLIVASVTREKNPARLNMLLPLFEGIRFSSSSIGVNPTHAAKAGGAKIDRQLAKDLATGRADYADGKKIKQTEAHILSDLMALYVRITRAAQSGQYSFTSIKTCIEGISINTGSVNSDLAIELEGELLELSKFYLVNKAGGKEDEGVLGAIALTALLNITKGSQNRTEILTGSILSGVELLVPVALNRLLGNSTPGCEDTLTSLCRGTIAVAAQFGSDKCLLSVAMALLNSLCLRFDDKSKLVVDLLIHVAARSPLVKTAIDPDGVLVDGADADRPLDRVEVSLFWQLQSLMANLGPRKKLADALLGNMGKYCRDLANQDRAEALLKEADERDEQFLLKKKRRFEKSAAAKK